MIKIILRNPSLTPHDARLYTRNSSDVVGLVEIVAV